MKTRTSIALAAVMFALGGAGVHTLYAQAKPPAFLIVELDIQNPDVFAKEYSPKAQQLTKKYGGKVLAASNKVTAFEGAPAKRIVIIQHESMEQVLAWHNAADVRELRKTGDKYGKFRYLALEGIPQQ